MGFEITFANPKSVARALLEHVSEWFMLFSMVHKLTFGFSVLAVINGIFIKETSKVAESDDLIMLMQKQRAMQLHRRKMQHLFDAADASSDGLVDKMEFCEIMGQKEVRTWLAAQELDASDAPKL